MAIVIPTRNHREIMEEWMKIFPEQNKKANVEVWVYDSSDNDDTKKICEENKEFVHYFRIEHDIGGPENVAYALNSVEAEYIWLFGDTSQLFYCEQKNWIIHGNYTIRG